MKIDIRKKLKKLPLWAKLTMLIIGALLFFIFFPFFIESGFKYLIPLSVFLAILLIMFRLIAETRVFRITLWLWAGGSIVYAIIAAVLILRGVQPLPYLTLEGIYFVLYYLSYPLRVLGIFLTGLIFAIVTSPVEFLKWGRAGLAIALAFRSFEYSVNEFEETRTALLVQGLWPDRGGKNRGSVFSVLGAAPTLIAVTFRNVILWFPWAYICYKALKKEIYR